MTKITNANWVQSRSHEIRGDQGCQQSEAHLVSARGIPQTLR